MLLNKNEINELKKYETETVVDTNSIFGINIKTFSVINDFLKEIRNSIKANGLFERNSKENTNIRVSRYEELYSTYENKVCESDRLIFSKLINFITAEGGDSKSYQSGYASNMPMKIEYVAKYKGKEVSGEYTQDTYNTESSLMYALGSYLLNAFGESEKQFYSKIEDKVSIKISSSYDVHFDIENLDALEKQVKAIIKSECFINWKFKGLRDDYEKEILGYIFAAKREVENHKEKNIDILGMNLNTCRYIASFMQFVKRSKFSNINTLEQKNKLYNKLYPYMLEMIDKDDRDIFAKLVNYLTFENEDYVVSGYNDFLNSSKADVLKRLELFDTVKNACEGKGKSKKAFTVETKDNVHPFSYMFTGGGAIFPKKGWMACGEDILRAIFNDSTFHNWEFSGLKTDSETNYKLEYNDKLKDLNFSENSYYILGYIVNKIHEEYDLNKKNKLKSKLKNLAISYIPLNERDVFNALFDYFTYQDENGLKVNGNLVRMDIDVISKDDKKLLGRHYTHGVSKFSDIKNEDIIYSVENGILPTRRIKDLNKDNLFEHVELRYRISISIFPQNFSAYAEMHYNQHKKANLIKSILDSLEDVKEFKESNLKETKEYTEKSTKIITKEIEVNSMDTNKETEIEVSKIEEYNEELSLFDLLASICENEKTTKESNKDVEESKVDDIEAYIDIKIVECENKGEESNLNGQLLFAI